MKLFILAALLATASASPTSAEVRLNDNTGASVAALRYNSEDRLVVADLTVPGKAQANTAEVSQFLATFHAEFEMLKEDVRTIKDFILYSRTKINDNTAGIGDLETDIDKLEGDVRRNVSIAIEELDNRRVSAIQQIKQEAKLRHAATNASALKIAERKQAELIEAIELEKQSLIDNEIQELWNASLEAQDAAVTIEMVNNHLATLKQSLLENEIRLAKDIAIQANNTANAKTTLAEAESKIKDAVKELAQNITRAQATADTKTTLSEVTEKITNATNKLVNDDIQIALNKAKAALVAANSKVSLEVLSQAMENVTETLSSTVQDAKDIAKTKTTIEQVRIVVAEAVTHLQDTAVRTAQTTADNATSLAKAAIATASAAATMQDITAEVSAASATLMEMIEAANSTATANEALDAAMARTTLETVEQKISDARDLITIEIGDAINDAADNEASDTAITLEDVTAKVNAAKADIAVALGKTALSCGAGKELDTDNFGDQTKQPCKDCSSGTWSAYTQAKCVPCRACSWPYEASGTCNKETGEYRCVKEYTCWGWYTCTSSYWS